MNRGDKVELRGYELMAVINYASSDSKAVVVHNNSSHILVLRSDEEIPVGEPLVPTGEAIFITSFRYNGQGQTFTDMYRAALAEAVLMAVGDVSDEP